MSKIFILVIICASIIPVVIFVMSYDADEIPPQNIEKTQITIPTATSSDGTSPSCAICAQISDSVPKAECVQQFACAE